MTYYTVSSTFHPHFDLFKSEYWQGEETHVEDVESMLMDALCDTNNCSTDFDIHYELVEANSIDEAVAKSTIHPECFLSRKNDEKTEIYTVGVLDELSPANFELLKKVLPEHFSAYNLRMADIPSELQEYVDNNLDNEGFSPIEEKEMQNYLQEIIDDIYNDDDDE